MKAFLVGVLALIFVAPVLAQDRVVVEISGDDNCTTAKGELGFDALTWSVGGTNAVNLGTSTGAGAGKPKLQDLVITRDQDACSEKLIKDFVSGTIIPTVTLTQYRLSGSSYFAAVTVTLSTAVLADYSISGANGIRPTENLDFAYSKVCVMTTAQNPDGSLKQPQKVCYDAAKGLVS